MMRDSIGDKNILQKRVPKNPKYVHTSANIDTGNSLTKQLKKLADRQRTYKYLENELFRRIKVLTFARLVMETHFVHDLDAVERYTSAQLPPATARPATPHRQQQQQQQAYDAQLPTYDAYPVASRRNPRPDRHNDSVSGLMADLDICDMQASLQKKVLSEYDFSMPYILLDVREPEAYNVCHIVGAISFPSILIKRDKVTRELLMYKNKTDKFIILYDDDDSVAGPMAQTLVLRGFENVYMLAGGLCLLTQKMHGITIGRYVAPVGSKGAMPIGATSSTGRTRLPPISTATSRSMPTLSSPRIPIRVDIDVFDIDALRASLENTSPTTSIASTVRSSRASSRMSMTSSVPSSFGMARRGLGLSDSPRSLYTARPPLKSNNMSSRS